MRIARADPHLVADSYQIMADQQPPRPVLTEALPENLLSLVAGADMGKIGPPAEALNVSLILYAEHEFNASTFFRPGHRVHPLTDLHGAITAAVATLKGPLHGGATKRWPRC